MDAGTNASDMEPSGPYFLGRPRFFLVPGSPAPPECTGAPPLPPTPAKLEADAALPPTGWYVAVAGGTELTGVKMAVPSVVYAMRRPCVPPEDGGVAGVFGSPNGSLPAITPCSGDGLTSIIPHRTGAPKQKRSYESGNLRLCLQRFSLTDGGSSPASQQIGQPAKRAKSCKNHKPPLIKAGKIDMNRSSFTA
jgi:hypothetical protein